MPQVFFYPAQIFWLIISFSILFIALRYFLLPPIEAILKEREEKIHSILNEADGTAAQAEKLEKEYQSQLDLATHRSAKMLQKAHDDIALEDARRQEELLHSLKQDVQKAKSTLKTKETSFLNRMETVSYNFVQGVLDTFYGIVLPEKELKSKIKKKVRELKNAK